MGPSELVVPGTLIFVIEQIAATAPSLMRQHAAQQPGIAGRFTRSLRLGSPHIQPDTRAWQDARAADSVQDRSIVPPKRRRHHREFAEHAWMAQANVERQ